MWGNSTVMTWWYTAGWLMPLFLDASCSNSTQPLFSKPSEVHISVAMHVIPLWSTKHMNYCLFFTLVSLVCSVGMRVWERRLGDVMYTQHERRAIKAVTVLKGHCAWSLPQEQSERAECVTFVLWQVLRHSTLMFSLHTTNKYRWVYCKEVFR